MPRREDVATRALELLEQHKVGLDESGLRPDLVEQLRRETGCVLQTARQHLAQQQRRRRHPDFQPPTNGFALLTDEQRGRPTIRNIKLPEWTARRLKALLLAAPEATYSAAAATAWVTERINTMRREEVAQLAGVPLDQVIQVSETDVRAAMAAVLPAEILELALSEEVAVYWSADKRYWLDDPFFGPPAPFDALRYDAELGLVDSSQAR
jgi:hypothetical protein